MVYVSKSGKAYEMRIGTRVQVKRGKAYKTSGGLTAKDIVVNSAGRYVSAAKHAWGKKHGKKQLADAGYDMFTSGSAGKVRKVRKTTKTKRSGKKKKAAY